MPLATSAATDALAHALAALRGVTPDEAVASALLAELSRQQDAVDLPPSEKEGSSVEEILRKIRDLGPWNGPTGGELTAELYDDAGLPR
jgi:hypothetical protein